MLISEVSCLNKLSSFFAHVSTGGDCSRSALGAFQRGWSGLIAGKTDGGRRSCLGSVYCAEEGGRRRLRFIVCVYPRRGRLALGSFHRKSSSFVHQ
jgi:hypothetical protein